ncbi:hypothetical protein PHMEG_00011802 [Phytophthora megakarya]|uniref:Apple domain-containing protein n=1 Tax=Phytophthora megakarya TaxID=4795 RepID=A0A225WAC9_9STRA|nr:hypothetical protein PHMEG_00011802 [Phytophthora megakarya]
MNSFQAIALLSAVYLLQADAFGLRSPIENPLAHRHLATCPTTTGVDYLGNDIKHVSGVQVSDCCSLCSQTSGCGAFTWTSYQGGTCWLKSAKGNTAANAAATSAVLVQDPPGCTLKDGYDYQDNDIANVQNTNNPGTEVPKAGVKSAEVKNNVGQCTLQPDMDFVDNDIGNAPGKSASDCCGICHNWSGCRSFSWSNQNGGTCWLKSAKGKTQYKAGVISSQLLDNPPPACTLEPGVDYVDNDLSNVPGAKPGDCCNKCRDTVGCHAFSWSNHNTGTCWLKSSKGSTVNKGGVTSAVVF